MMKNKAWLDAHLPSLVGKSILITGATSGIGFQAALALLYKGAKVTIACRDVEKAALAKAAILREVPNPAVSFLFYDQSVPSSIGSLAQNVENECFDSIVFNAGIYFPKKGAQASDGTSLTFFTNVVGTYLLFEALRKKHSESRFVFVNSVYNRTPRGGNYQNYLKANKFSRANQYAVSKRGIMNLFAYASALEDTEAVMCHPGVSKTGIIRNFAPWFKRLGNGLLYLFVHKSWKACLGLVYLAAGEGEEGDYLVPRGPFHISGYPKIAPLPERKCRKDYQDLIAELKKDYPLKTTLG